MDKEQHGSHEDPDDTYLQGLHDGRTAALNEVREMIGRKRALYVLVAEGDSKTVRGILGTYDGILALLTNLEKGK